MKKLFRPIIDFINFTYWVSTKKEIPLINTPQWLQSNEERSFYKKYGKENVFFNLQTKDLRIQEKFFNDYSFFIFKRLNIGATSLEYNPEIHEGYTMCYNSAKVFFNSSGKLNVTIDEKEHINFGDFHNRLINGQWNLW